MRPLALMLLTITVLFWGATQAPARAQDRVDVAIILAVDGSASIDSREFRLQMAGIAEAIRHPKIIQAISRGAHGAVALTLMQWSTLDQQYIAVPWRRVTDSASAEALAADIQGVPRIVRPSGTAIGDAVVYATRWMAQLPFRADRHVIDISGDGKNVHPPLIRLAREAALQRGITINGLPIISNDPSIHHYYQDTVIGGPGAFVEVAASFDDFAVAMRRKLLREIQGPVVSLRGD